MRQHVTRLEDRIDKLETDADNNLHYSKLTNTESVVFLMLNLVRKSSHVVRCFEVRTNFLIAQVLNVVTRGHWQVSS
jgi:hypothetical protein